MRDEPLRTFAWEARLYASDQGGLATAFDLAAFRLSMIAPVKKSVNHSRTMCSEHARNWLRTVTASRSSSSQRFESVE